MNKINSDSQSEQSINNSTISNTKNFKISNKNKVQDYRNMIAGFTSSIFSRTISAPFDRLKMLYQVNYIGSDKKPPKIITGMKNIYLLEGIQGYFRGNFINLIKGSPETAIKLYLFEKIKWKTQNFLEKEKLSNVSLFLIGSISGIISTFAVFPLEVIKLRIGATDKNKCPGILKTTKNIYREPRGIVNFYSGLEASTCSAMASNGILLFCYEKLKILFTGKNSIDNAKYLGTTKIALIGSLSAIISSTIIYPFQIVQARMIIHNLKKHEVNLIKPTFFENNKNFNVNNKMSKFNGTKFIMSINTISQVEGIKGFYKGYIPAIVKLSIGNGCGFAIYEKMKVFLGISKVEGV
jgi:hypothetical protein